MNLAVEAVGVKHGGGSVVLMEVLESAVQSESVERVTVFCSPRTVRRFDLPASNKIVEVPLPVAEASVWGRVNWLVRKLPGEIQVLRPDILICMSGIGRSRGKTTLVTFVQQSLPFCREALDRCDFATKVRMQVIRTLMTYSCRKAALIIAQTPTMSRWIQSSCNLPSRRVMVVEPWGRKIGMDSEQQGNVDAMHSTPPDRRLLYVGNTSPYKNLDCLVSALPDVRQRRPGTVLFLTCPPDHPFCKIDGVVGLGYLGGSTLRTAYELATLFITASLVESGNLTLIESMSAGTPVVAAKRPYAQDLCGDAAVYFDPNDAPGLADVVVSLLESERKRMDLSRRGIELVKQGHQARPYEQMIDKLFTMVHSTQS